MEGKNIFSEAEKCKSFPRNTLKYLRTVLNLLEHNVKLFFIWLAKRTIYVVEQCFKPFSINLNAQHMNGKTPFDFSIHNGKLIEKNVRLFDTVE